MAGRVCLVVVAAAVSSGPDGAFAGSGFSALLAALVGLGGLAAKAPVEFSAVSALVMALVAAPVGAGGLLVIAPAAF